MPIQRSYQDATPIELLNGETTSQKSVSSQPSKEDEQARSYVIAWRDKLRYERIEKVNVWNECWALYRGQEDFSNKEDWQSKIVLPKAWGTVKSAVSTVKRLLNYAKKPWRAQPINQDDAIWELRGEKMTDLSKFFLDKASFLEEFSVGMETGFIMGLGVWKFGWDMSNRQRTRVITKMIPIQGNPALTQPYGPSQAQPVGPPTAGAGMAGTVQPGGPTNLPTQLAAGGSPAHLNQPQVPEQQPPQRMGPEAIGQSREELIQQQNEQYPTQLSQESLLPPGGLNAGMAGMFSGAQPLLMPQKQIVREDVLEGNLTVNAVDPYFFYWLPGSKLNKWTGTIEEMEVPKWQLMEMANNGAFDPKLIEDIGPMLIPEYQRQVYLRFGEMPRGPAGVNNDTGIVKLTEFYGPLVVDGKVKEKHAHIIIANDTWVLKNGTNDKWFNTPPYCAFSPLMLPFRTEGVGLVENVRYIDRALNQIVNLGVDTLMFRLMPLFEFTPDVYENPEDLRNGITPGKMLRRNTLALGNEMGIKPVQFEDVSPGASQMAGILDRAHQEGGLVTELQQSLPRWSGAQTATETTAIQQNQDSFFGSLAADIEQYALRPMIKMAIDIIMQYIDTANDPRVAQVLGVDQAILSGMTHPEIYEMISGDYDIMVTGITDQLEKAEMLQNLIQLMNIIGQNPESWLPWINQDMLLRRILESFRPTIHDIEKIVADPQTAQANKMAMQQQEQQNQMMQLLPKLHDMAAAHEKTMADQAQAAKEHQDNMDSKSVDQAIQLHGINQQAKQAAAKQQGGK